MENTKKFSFNYDLSALPTYEAYASDQLIKAVLGLTLPKYSTPRPNLKGTTTNVGWLENDVYLQDMSCGFNSSGTTVQNIITIDMCNKKVNQTLCPTDLYDTYLAMSLSNSNIPEQVPFEELILTDISNRIANQVENQLWLNSIGSTSLGGAAYTGACFNGMTQLITSANGATQIAYTAATESNGLDVFSTIYQNIPQNILHRDDLTIYCSYANYRGLVASMRKSSYINMFTDPTGNATQGPDWALTLPGSNCKVIPTVGLTNVSAYYAGASKYVQFGMNSEIMSVKAIWDPFENIVKIIAGVSYGVGVFDVDSWAICK